MGRGMISKAVDEALAAAELLPQDAAGQALVRRYAEAIDADPTAEVLSDLGPKLLAALTALGLTPAGRGVKGGAATGGGVVSTKLDELRARRERRSG